MPLTPFHPLAFLFLYFRDKQRVDPLALAVSTSLIDLEPLYYTVLGEPLYHRVWHGFTLALTIYPILVAVGVYIAERLFEEKLWTTYTWLRLKPVKVRYPMLNIYLLSLFGSFSHITLDMFTHPEMFWVFYPLIYRNPFYIQEAVVIVEIAVILLTVYSLICWFKR
ncbi:MAG: DUF4184 family protein [Candidatus Bathyarchaeia archaeon]